ncbi:MAG TPA: hypothetical protein VFZ34_00930 [Blastocatellia bacterium]|nr:hypothetical protein [Blastocatellia bacterium]
MTENIAIEAMHRALREARDARKRSEARLIDLEAEAAMLRSQIASLDLVIEQTSGALKAAMFPAEYGTSATPPVTERTAPPKQPPAPRVAPPPARRAAQPPQPVSYYPDEEQVALELEDLEAIEAGTAAQKLNKNSGNIRFNDFRIPQAATIVLREANGPLHVSEIYQRMAEGGFEFRGQHQLITLAVSLSRAKRFRKVAPGTFELDPRYAAGQVA